MLGLHEALAMRTPAELYRPSDRSSQRSLSRHTRRWYPHTVDSTGKMIHRRWSVYLSKVLSRYIVAVEERATDCRVWFCNLLLGSYVDTVDKKVSPVPQEVTVPVAQTAAMMTGQAGVEKGDPVATQAAQPRRHQVAGVSPLWIRFLATHVLWRALGPRSLLLGGGHF